jgi:hypothetical protein
MEAKKIGIQQGRSDPRSKSSANASFRNAGRHSVTRPARLQRLPRPPPSLSSSSQSFPMLEAAQNTSYMTDPVRPYPSAQLHPPLLWLRPLSWDRTASRILWHDDRARRELHPVLPGKGAEERSLKPPIAAVPPRVRSREREFRRLSFRQTRSRAMGNCKPVG